MIECQHVGICSFVLMLMLGETADWRDQQDRGQYQTPQYPPACSLLHDDYPPGYAADGLSASVTTDAATFLVEDATFDVLVKMLLELDQP